MMKEIVFEIQGYGEITYDPFEQALNILSKKANDNALAKGFGRAAEDLPKALMLIVSELSEALEADREGKWAAKVESGDMHALHNLNDEEYAAWFKTNVKDTVQDELADAIIRLFNVAGDLGLDLDFHVRAKMRYNSTRPFKHGKKY